jgi:hypothetical protein
MIIDRQSTVSLNQAVTSTAVSNDTIDLLVAGRDIGNGEQIEMTILCTEAATASGSATVTFELINSASADLSSPVVLATTAAIGKAAITVGAQFLLQTIPLNAAPLRYLGVRYTVATGPLTAGKFTATFGGRRDATKAYRSGIPVGGF